MLFVMVRLPEGVCDLRPGLFGLVRYNRNWSGWRAAYVEWYSCLDSFQYAWGRNKKHCWEGGGFFYCDPKRNVRPFISQVERALRLRRKTKIYNANVRDVCGILPAPFWQKYEMRMSLFAVLVRAAEHYDPKVGWVECLLKHPCAQETKEAIDYFFDGHTICRDCHFGWCYAFNYGGFKKEDLLRRPLLSSAWRRFKAWLS